MKTALITGGSKGIGKAICLAFARKGYNVVFTYNSTEPKEVLEEIEKLEVEGMAIKCNVSNFDNCKEVVEKTLEKFGTIDVVVNNAGITKDSLIIKMSEDDFDSVIETNLKGTFNMTKLVVAKMLKQKSGSIINMSSVIGLSGNIGQSNYSASKSGIVGLTKSVAKEVARKGVTCNAVAPGFITTDMTDTLPKSVKENVLNSIPLKRFGSVEDISNAVLFLEENKYITGQVINIDGGLLI